MKVVILAGGLGSRLSEETRIIPKPMVQIGGKPILWHIMKIYSYYGFNDFVILTGYLSHVIKDFFINYYYRYSDLTIDLQENSIEIHKTETEPWKVTLLYTGPDTLTGGRISRAREHLKDGTFMLTYGDGVADIDLNALVECHKTSGCLCTLTAVQPGSRFGELDLSSDGHITSFMEKPKDKAALINGGFMVCEPQVLDYLPLPPLADTLPFEQGPLQQLARDGQLNSYRHTGFWHAMDTLKDNHELNKLWQTDNAPWAVWRQQEA